MLVVYIEIQLTSLMTCCAANKLTVTLSDRGMSLRLTCFLRKLQSVFLEIGLWCHWIAKKSRQAISYCCLRLAETLLDFISRILTPFWSIVIGTKGTLG